MFYCFCENYRINFFFVLPDCAKVEKELETLLNKKNSTFPLATFGKRSLRTLC